MCVCGIVACRQYVSVCVRERKREGDRVRVCVFMCVFHTYVCLCVEYARAASMCAREVGSACVTECEFVCKGVYVHVCGIVAAGVCVFVSVCGCERV